MFGGNSLSSDYSTAVISTCFFAFTVASSFRTHYNRQTSSLRSGLITSTPKVDLHDYVLLEIRQPISGPEKITQTVQNDDIISKTVPLVKKGLYIYICASVDLPKSAVCEYISDTYSRVWDEMLQNNRLSMNCVVVGDVYGSDLMTREQMRSLPELGALFSFENESQSSIELLRTNSKLEKVSFLNTDGLTNYQPLIPGSPGTSAVYYFDADNIHIPRYRKVAMGGTFDQLHNGHRKLLTLAAASCSDLLIIGVMGDDLLRGKSNSSLIAKCASRMESVVKFLSIAKPSMKCETIELSDPFGPTITDPSIDAIVVSSETVGGALKINQMRYEKGLPPLVILVSRRSGSATMSSSFMRVTNQPLDT